MATHYTEGLYARVVGKQGRKPRKRCPAGHSYAKANVRMNGGKRVRYCLVCNRERVRRFRAMRRAA